MVWQDRHQIETILRTHDPLRGLPVLGFDRYNASDIRGKQFEFGMTFGAILDRNVLSRILSLRASKRTVVDDLERQAAAVMAFAQVGNIDFDPSAAIAGTAMANGDQQGKEEAVTLVGMQNLDPQVYADIALGRSQAIDDGMLGQEHTPELEQSTQNAIAKMWRFFRPNYGAALKLALIRLGGDPDAVDSGQFAEFLRWFYDDYMFLPGAVLYGSLALGRSRRARMFKGLRSGNMDRAVAGVRNMAWDMATLNYWSRCVMEGADRNRYVMLCSFDRALLECSAHCVPQTGFIAANTDLLRARWKQEWGRAGEDLADQYLQHLVGHATDSTRAAHRHAHRTAHWEAMIADLERQFIEAVCGLGGSTAPS